jgi:hypothetical protein
MQEKNRLINSFLQIFFEDLRKERAGQETGSGFYIKILFP